MVKTTSFAVVHFLVAFSVGYLMTGSIAIGGAIAVVEPLCNTVAYYLHEKIWEKKLKGRPSNGHGFTDRMAANA